MDGIVYLICDTANNLFKIGVTKGKIENRIKKLQTGNATELFLSNYHTTKYPYRMEKMLHTHFENKRVLNEWFELTNEDVANFSNTCELMEERINILLDNPFFVKKLH